MTEIGNTALNLMTTGNLSGGSNNQVTNFSVKISILASSYAHLTSSSDSPFRPGMTATVDVLTKREKGVLSIPIKSVTMRPDTAGEPKVEHAFSYWMNPRGRHYCDMSRQESKMINTYR